MPNETISELSDYYNISIEEIKKINKDITNEDELKAYSTIKIPKKQKTKKSS